jgi:hypothetical protein
MWLKRFCHRVSVQSCRLLRLGRRLQLQIGAILAMSTLPHIGNSAPAESWLTQYPAVVEKTNAACKADRLKECEAGLKRLETLLLQRPDITCRLGIVEAKLGHKNQALKSLDICARSQLEFDRLLSEPAVRKLGSLPGFAEVESTYRRGLLPVGDHELLYSLNDAGLLAEDVAYDPHDESLLISSVHARKIVRVAKDGGVSDFVTVAQIPMWAVFALSADAHRDICWATTTAVVQSPPYAAADEGHSAVLQIGLRSGALIHRYELTDHRPHEFGDVTLGDDGTLYVSDGRSGGVYVIRPKRPDVLEALVEPGTFESPQTPVFAADRGLLLVPDYSRGIGIVSPAGREVTWLQHPPALSLAGIDGLYLQGHTLVAIQNGTVPERVLVMTVDAGYRRVTQWRVALARAPGMGDPTHGIFRGENFLALVNSGWDRVDSDGNFKNEAGAPAAQIWRIPLPEAAPPAGH